MKTIAKLTLIVLALIACAVAGYGIGQYTCPSLPSPFQGEGQGEGPYDAYPSNTTTFNNISTGSLTASGAVTANSLTASSATINGSITLANGETISNATDGHILMSGYLHAFTAPIIKTANYTLTLSDMGSIVTNQGATGDVTFTLPSATAGYAFCFYVYAAQNFYIDPATGDQIHALTNSAGDRITNATAGSAICLVAIDTTYWVPYGTVGTWTDAN